MYKTHHLYFPKPVTKIFTLRTYNHTPPMQRLILCTCRHKLYTACRQLVPLARAPNSVPSHSFEYQNYSSYSQNKALRLPYPAIHPSTRIMFPSCLPRHLNRDQMHKVDFEMLRKSPIILISPGIETTLAGHISQHRNHVPTVPIRT